MPRRHSQSLVLAVVAATALALAGGAAPAGAKPTGDPIKVMVIYEKSAGIANPEMAEGVIAAAKALNKKDGIGGRPVKVTECDTRNDPNVAAECARTAVDEGYVALLNNLTVHSQGVLPLMVENKIPSIGIVLAGVADMTSKAAFPITGGGFATLADLPRFLADEGAKVISIVRPDIAAAAALVSVAADPALEPLGLAIKNDVAVPTSAPDMTTYVQQTLAGGTDAVVVALPGQQAINFIQSAKQADPKVKLALISTESGPVRKALGDQTAGVIQGWTLLPVDAKVPTNARFKKDMKAAGYKDLSGFRNQGWLSVQLLATIAEGLPEVTGPAVFDKINTATGIETGLTPPLQWTTPVIAGTRIFNGCELAIRLDKKGKGHLVTGTFFDALANEECPTP